MKLYPAANEPGGPLAPADWTISIDSEKRGEATYFFADVNRDGAPVCRLAVTGACSEEEAHRRLAVKARLWINDYFFNQRGVLLRGLVHLVHGFADLGDALRSARGWPR
jgi:hypothetical protein